MQFKGYGADAEFDGTTLHLVARNAFAGVAGLGAKERHIPVADIDAVSVKAANMVTNGNLTVQVGDAKYVVHFLKKGQADAFALNEAVLAASGADPARAPSGTTPNDRIDAANVRVAAWSERLGEKAERSQLAAAQEKLARAETAAFPSPAAPPVDAVPDTEPAQQAAEVSGPKELVGWDAVPKVDALPAAPSTRAELRQAAAAATAEAKAVAAATRSDARAARAQAKDDKRAAKVASVEAKDAAIQAFAVGTLEQHSEEHGVPDGWDGWMQADKQLRAAMEHAAAGEIEAEERAIRAAVQVAKAVSGRAARKATEQRVTAMTGRSLRVGSFYIGTVIAEDVFSQHGRKGKLLQVVTAEKWCEVRSDRVITPTNAYPIDATTTAQVYLDGEALVTQRPTLTRMALLSPLPGSALIPGMALQKKEKTDSRQGEFQVGGLGWSLRVIVHPDRLSSPRQLAEQINRHAGDRARTAETAPPQPAATQAVHATSVGDDVLTKLERLQALVGSGAITQQEADVLKRDILS